MKQLILLILSFILISSNCYAYIDSKEFENVYFNVKKNTKFLNDFANELTKYKLCLFNCAQLAESLGFYHKPDGSIKYGRIETPYEMLSPDISNHPLLGTFYDAVNHAMIVALIEGDPEVYVEPVGVFHLTEAGNVSFGEWNKKDEKNEQDWLESIPGVEVIASWIPVSGLACVYLTYESGHICYNDGSSCYNYEFSLSFKQVGLDDYGVKRYLAPFSNDWYNLFLPGYPDGGVLVRVLNSALPTTDSESCFNLQRGKG